MGNSNNGLSIVAGVVSLVAAVSLVALLVSVEDARLLWVAIGGGAIGAVVGLVARRGGANTWNGVGLWLGVVTLVASIAVLLYFTPGETTVTEVTEDTSNA